MFIAHPIRFEVHVRQAPLRRLAYKESHRSIEDAVEAAEAHAEAAHSVAPGQVAVSIIAVVTVYGQEVGVLVEQVEVKPEDE